MTLKSLVFLAAFVWAAFAHAQGLHVVFDLDAVLVENLGPTTSQSETGPEALSWNGETYRLADFAPEAILSLRDAGYKIAIFATGASARDRALIEHLAKRIRERTGRTFTPDQILGPQDLTPVLGKSANLPLAARSHLDLQRVWYPADVVRVAASRDFLAEGQERSLLEIAPGFRSVRERQKLLVVMEILLQARAHVGRMPMMQFLKSVRGVAHGTTPGAAYDDEAYLDLLRKGLHRFGLPLRLNAPVAPHRAPPLFCDGIYR